MSVLFAVQLVLSDLNIVFAVLEQWETVWISGLGGFKRYVFVKYHIIYSPYRSGVQFVTRFKILASSVRRPWLLFSYVALQG